MWINFLYVSGGWCVGGVLVCVHIQKLKNSAVYISECGDMLLFFFFFFLQKKKKKKKEKKMEFRNPTRF